MKLSLYVRQVQMQGRTVTITHHGRPAAILAPLAAPGLPGITVRAPVERQPLGKLDLRPRPGRGASVRAIRGALDEERHE